MLSQRDVAQGQDREESAFTPLTMGMWSDVGIFEGAVDVAVRSRRVQRSALAIVRGCEPGRVAGEPRDSCFTRR